MKALYEAPEVGRIDFEAMERLADMSGSAGGGNNEYDKSQQPGGEEDGWG